MQYRGGTDLDHVPCLLCLQLPPHHTPHPPPLLGLLHHQSRLQGVKTDHSKNFYPLRWCWRTTQWRTPGVSQKAPVTRLMMDLLYVKDAVVVPIWAVTKRINDVWASRPYMILLESLLMIILLGLIDKMDAKINFLLFSSIKIHLVSKY